MPVLVIGGTVSSVHDSSSDWPHAGACRWTDLGDPVEQALGQQMAQGPGEPDP